MIKGNGNPVSGFMSRTECSGTVYTGREGREVDQREWKGFRVKLDINRRTSKKVCKTHTRNEGERKDDKRQRDSSKREESPESNQ